MACGTSIGTLFYDGDLAITFCPLTAPFDGMRNEVRPMSALNQLARTGTKIYLDSIAPHLVQRYLDEGAEGATSNPSIIAALVASGNYDDVLADLLLQSPDDRDVAWSFADFLAVEAEQEFMTIWENSEYNEGWVSFEVDPMIESDEYGMTIDERVEAYVAQSHRARDAGSPNRMIKIPATRAGLLALTPLAAAGIPLNVTLIFTPNQYELARAAVAEGLERNPNPRDFKSVYSVFVSRIEQYAKVHLPYMSDEATSRLPIANAKQIWLMNQDFWSKHPQRLDQEIVFASTGTKDPADRKWKYVAALAGADIQTIPPDTLAAIEEASPSFRRKIDEPENDEIIDEIERTLDLSHMHKTLLREGMDKFIEAQRNLEAMIAKLRSDSNPTKLLPRGN
jgi:transaldolase